MFHDIIVPFELGHQRAGVHRDEKLDDLRP
jgi:hypothetical protein